MRILLRQSCQKYFKSIFNFFPRIFILGIIATCQSIIQEQPWNRSSLFYKGDQVDLANDDLVDILGDHDKFHLWKQVFNRTSDLNSR